MLKQTHELEQMRLEARAGCVLEFCVFQRELPAKQFHIVVEGPGPLPAVMPLQAPSRVFVDYVPPPPTLVAELRGFNPAFSRLPILWPGALAHARLACVRSGSPPSGRGPNQRLRGRLRIWAGKQAAGVGEVFFA